MSIEDFDHGDRVQVRWYGGENMNCVVVDTSDGKGVVRESEHDGGTDSTVLFPGEKDIVEEPIPKSTAIMNRIQKEHWYGR